MRKRKNRLNFNGECKFDNRAIIIMMSNSYDFVK